MTDSSSDPRTATGMVDRLDSRGSGPSEDELKFVRAYLANQMDASTAALLSVPEVIKAREQKVAELRARDWPNLSQYRDANRALDGRAVKAVFIGDSLTEFWAEADLDLFSGGVVGRGISGQTSPQVLLRFMTDVIALKPQVVHLLIGTNDLASNTGPSTLADYQNHIVAMLTLAQSYGVRVILGSVLPAFDFPWKPGIDPKPRIAQINQWLQVQARERGLIYADYYPALATPEGALRPEFTRDGVHPTAAGYVAMRPIALAALAAALA
jgi:lysophospholipase L1-like esterase